MEEVTKTLYIVKKCSFCIAASYFAYEVLIHTIKQKHYSLFVSKVCKNIRKVLRSNRKQPKKEFEAETIFFWAENVKCRKHIMTKTPCDINFCSYYKLQYIINFIQNATETIDLCMFLLTSTDIAKSLVDAYKKGVIVRVIVDEEMSTSSESKIQLLINEGILVKSKVLPTFMHHKFCLIDANSAEKQRLLTGSLNWTFQGIAGNWENVIILRHSEIVEAFNEEFNNIWGYFNVKQKKLVPLNNY